MAEVHLASHAGVVPSPACNFQTFPVSANLHSHYLSLSPFHAVKMSFAAPTNQWILAHPHKLDELEFFALRYFDSGRWSHLQLCAVHRLRGLLLSNPPRVEYNLYQPRPTAPIVLMIQLIGEIFFLDGLRNAKFEWAQDGNNPRPGWTEPARDTIVLNMGAPDWKSVDQNNGRKLLRDFLLHEAAHLYLARHANEEILRHHNASWVSITMAIEKQLRQRGETYVDLRIGAAVKDDLFSFNMFDERCWLLAGIV